MALRILITGGPTRAYLDKVRFLSNVSTGGLAYSLAKYLKRHRVEISMIVGPSAFDFEGLKLKRLTRIETTDEMRDAVMKECRRFRPHFAVFSAAVLDFTPAKIVPGKVSSKKSSWIVRMKPTPKIIDEVGKRFPKIKRVGFKLEAISLRGKALEKFGRKILIAKNLDALCANFLPEVGEKSHRAYLFSSDGAMCSFRTKSEIAAGISRYLLLSEPITNIRQ